MEASMRFTWRSTWLIFPILFVACSRPPEIPEEDPRVPVKLETVERVSFQPTLTLLGVVRPAGEAQVVIPVAGRLRYPARFRDGLSSGVQVRAGEVLARIDNQEAEQSLAESRLRLEASSRELDRYQKAFDNGVVSAAQLAQYKAEADLAGQRVTAARQRQSSLDLRSPVSGWLLVERRLPPEGEVQAGTALARFAVAGSKETAGRGVVREIAPMVDAGGTLAVVAEVTAGDALPPPGEGVEVLVELDRREQTMTVPEEALLVSEGGAAVFVAEGNQARRRTVTTGGRADGRVEVLTGLSPGDKVVVEGASLLSDGTRLTPIQEPAGATKPEGNR
jgi:multidrug efflux system membrane fusion protein